MFVFQGLSRSDPDTMIEPEHFEDTVTPKVPPRQTWAAVKRGLRGRCPACGEGRILHSYLKVNDACAVCGEELHHHRADDFPQYITIFVVAHVLVAALLMVDDLWPDVPMAVHMIVWPSLVIAMSLWLLPIFKGALIAYQWALRMHGFETAHQAPQAALPDAERRPLQRSAA